MKIAMVSMNAGPLAWLGGVDGGGQSVVVDCLSDALARLGHQVTVYTQRGDVSLPRCLTTATGVHVHHIDSEPPATAAPMLAGAIERFGRRLGDEWVADRPNLVHAHSWMSGSAASGAARTLGLPIIQTFHGLARPKSHRRSDGADDVALRIAEETALVRGAGRIIATSSAEVFGLLGLGASPGAIRLIPCGVDLQLFAPAVRPATRGPKPFRIVTLGRLVPDAGVADAIEALREVDGVELTIGGGRYDAPDVMNDPDARALAERARACGVGGRVTLRGRVRRDEVAAFLQSADALVCTPWHDSIGTVVLEAMACGVPAIVSTVGALVDAVTDGMTGLHVPPRAPRQLAYAIAALKADPVASRRFGRLGFERATARYSWSRIATETIDVYTSVAVRASQVTSTLA